MTVEERFWSKVRKLRGRNACWVWTASIKRGYGRFWFNGKTIRAHRFIYELLHGSTPEGFCVLHTCDNPPCVRPSHLYLGTQQDNSDDKWARGRAKPGTALCGEANPYHKLTAKQVAAIRVEYAAGGISHRKLAQKYEVYATAIGKILRGERWTALDL